MSGFVILHTTLRGWHCGHFADVETEAQRGEEICLRSQNCQVTMDEGREMLTYLTPGLCCHSYVEKRASLPLSQKISYVIILRNAFTRQKD